MQGYLAPAPGGLDAHFAWTIPGGTGAGVSICDMEVGWNLNHEDLPPATVMIPDGESLASPYEDDHGTEVLGTMFSLPNGWGTTGASYDARCLVAPIWLDSGYGLFQQILWAASQLEAGDVILLEAQTPGPYYRGDGTQVGYVPVEWEPSVYNAILIAVGNGIHVVEPVGNGAQNLDDSLYQAGNYGYAPFLPENDSGAIMVGAGIPPTAPELGPDRSRSVFSNFGSRVDVQSWGHRVTTTGAGDLYSQEGTNLLYTRFFGGTSSAGPLVASAVASIEGIAEHGAAGTVPPQIMRALLRETGTPQQDGARPASQEPIGPRPDLRVAIARMSTPIVAAPRVVHAFEGDLIHFAVDAADMDGDPITSFTCAALPAGASFVTSLDNASGQVEWNTAVGEAGTYVLIFSASSTSEASDTTRIELESAERGPVITGPGGELGVEGGPSIRVVMSAIDPNGDPIISFIATSLPRGATFATDSTNTTGTLTWRPDFDQAGQHVVAFEATSASAGAGLEIGHGWLGLTILNNDREPIVVAPHTVRALEGETIVFSVSASDPDGEAITRLYADQIPPGATFLPDPSNQSGTFAWTPTFDQASLYIANFFAENVRVGRAATFLQIDNSDRPPVVNAPLQVEGMEGQEVVVEATVSDPDGDAILELLAEGLPLGSQFTTDAAHAAGHMSWTPRSGQAGQYTVTLIAVSRSIASRADSAIVLITIESGHFAARVFSESQTPIRLSSGAARTCLHVEPVGGDFNLGTIDPATVVLNWTGGGDAIHAAQTTPDTTADRDQNGIVDLATCFSKDDLRRLFGGIQGDRQTVRGSLSGELYGGGTFEAAVDLDIVPQRGRAFVTPNPSRGAPVLSFYTSKSTSVRLAIFDSRGRLLRTVIDLAESAQGFHDVALGLGSKTRLPVGMYYYKLDTSDGTATGKFIVLR